MNATGSITGQLGSPAKVLISMPLPCTGSGVSYTCTSIARNMDHDAVAIELFTPYGTEQSGRNYQINRTLPIALRALPFRTTRKMAIGLNEAQFLKASRRVARSGHGVAYMWPDPSLSLLRRLRDTGIPIVREMVNCHRALGRRVLEAEYRRLGLVPEHFISQELVDAETQALELCDYMFCSNKHVEQSLLETGVPAHKIREASFGWDPSWFQGEFKSLEPIDGATFLFVGLICVRKGAHLIPDYWARSGIKGRLVMIGVVEPAIQRLCAQHLSRDDVTVLKYTRDLGPIYRSADAFVFPSLEEGGPQVPYEAGGCGVPLITSPMGAGRIADASTGYVVDPYDGPRWIDAMRSLAEDKALRSRMSAAAKEKAYKYTWREVGQARQRVFQQIAASAYSTAEATTASPALNSI